MSAFSGRRVDDVVQHEAGVDHRFDELLGLQRSAPAGRACAGRDRLALRQRLLVALLAGLFVAAQFAVDAVQRGARGGQVLLDDARAGPAPPGVRPRSASTGASPSAQLRDEFVQARFELAALAAHALQRLASARPRARAAIPASAPAACAASRDSRAALRAASRCSPSWRRSASSAGARLRGRPSRDGLFQPGTRLARPAPATASRVCAQRAPARRRCGRCGCARFQLALLALQLAGEFGHAAMREVQRALRVLAMLFGVEQLVAHLVERLVDRGFRFCQRFDLGAQRLDLAFARSAPCWASPERSTRTQPAPSHSPLRVMTDSPSASCGSRRRASASVIGDMDARQQATDGRRALHLRRQRGRRHIDVAVVGRRHQRDAALRRARPAHRASRSGASTVTAFDQAAKRGLRRRFPSRLRPSRLSPRRGVAVEALAFSQSSATLFSWPSAACCRASSDDRRPRAAWICLRTSASSVCCCALLFLQRGQRWPCASRARSPSSSRPAFCVSWSLAHAPTDGSASASGSRPPRSLASASRRRPASSDCFSRYSILVRSTSPSARLRPAPWRRCPSAAASRAASLRRRAGLPGVQLSSPLQRGQLRLGLGDRRAQLAQLALVAADVLARSARSAASASSRARFQALLQLALVLDLLLDARQLAADPVALGLHLAQGVAGFGMLARGTVSICASACALLGHAAAAA